MNIKTFREFAEDYFKRLWQYLTIDVQEFHKCNPRGVMIDDKWYVLRYSIDEGPRKTYITSNPTEVAPHFRIAKERYDRYAAMYVGFSSEELEAIPDL